MQIRWFDHAGVGGISKFFNGISATPVKHDECLQRGDIVFVHPETETKWRQWVKCAMDNQDVHIILMSRTPVGMGWDEQGPANVHKCDYPADSLGHYERVFEFIKSAGSGEPDWDLLRLESCPEHLVAAYILMLAAADNVFDKRQVAQHLENNFWTKVRNEANERGWELDLPADWDFYTSWNGAGHRNAAVPLKQKLAELQRRTLRRD